MKQSKAPQELPLLKLIGKGSFSEVSLLRFDGLPVACKSIKLPLKTSIQNLLDEISILKSSSHPNIVKLYKISMTSFDKINLYLEYIEGATLDAVYSRNKNEELLFYWIFQLCLALHYLHERKIIHRDIKPENIMVNKKGVLKLLDFGLSKIALNHHSQIIGTPYFIAPEIFTTKRVYDKSDIWSLGMSIYFLIHNKNPFVNNEAQLEAQLGHSLLNSAQEQTEKNKKKRSIEKYFEFVIQRDTKFGSECSEQMQEILRCMLEKDHKKRMTAGEILKHPVMVKRVRKFRDAYFGQKTQSKYIY